MKKTRLQKSHATVPLSSMKTDAKPRKNKKIKSCLEMEKNIFFLLKLQKKHEASFPTLLGHVGCYILFNRKIIPLKRLYFLLKFLDQKLTQLLYMDTDSAHFVVKHKILQENVSHHLKPFSKNNLTNTLKVDAKCLAYVSMNVGNIWQKNASDCIKK